MAHWSARIVASFGMALVLTGCGDSEPAESGSNEALFDRTLKELEADMATEEIPGMSVAIVIDGKLAFSAALGIKSQKTQEPVTTQTLFRVCSMTKMLTSAAVLDLVEEGKLNLHKPVKDYVPFLDFDTTAPVTLHHLLTHTAGIEENFYDPPYVSGAGAYEEWFTAHPKIPVIAPPGTLNNYSNTGYGAAAAVIESVTGQPFNDVIHERVMLPMGMTTATMEAEEALKLDHASGHSTEAGVPPESGIDTAQYSYAMWNPGGGAIATAEDYAHFVEAILAGGGILEPASVEAMTTAHSPLGSGWDYGYGTFLMDVGGERTVLHAGGARGWTSYVGWVPARKLGVVLLTNSSDVETMPYLSEEVLVVLARFLRSDELPDYATSPTEWVKYVGGYKGTTNLAHDFDVTRDADGALWVKQVGATAPEKLQHGHPLYWHSGGSTFFSSKNVFVFWPGPSGQTEYMAGFDFIAVRKP